MPPIASSIWRVARTSPGLSVLIGLLRNPVQTAWSTVRRNQGSRLTRLPSDRGERDGAHRALMLKVEEQPVGAGAGYLDVKRDLRSRARVSVAGVALG